MSKSVNYAILDEFLADESLSLNECARRTGCSSWIARRRYRQLIGDDRPMKSPRIRQIADDDDAVRPTGSPWAGLGLLALFVVGCIALRARIGRIDLGERPMP